MNAIPPLRRFALAGTDVALAALLFHGQIAAALITRGDDLLRAGDIDGAVAAYERATQLGGTTSAFDRLAFYLLVRRQPGDTMRALRVANAALARVPGDPALLSDRAFASLRLHRFADAARDFAAAGAAAHDLRFTRLAHRLALR